MANAAAAALATTPRSTAKPTPVDLNTVATLTGRTLAELEKMLAERARQITEHGRARPCDIPESVDGRCDRDETISWAQRMGWHRYRGRAVIGYAGMALLLDLSEQSLRKLSTLRQHHIRTEHRPRPEDIPAQIPGTAGKFALFDLAAILRWAIQTGRLSADGKTPIPLRPATTATRKRQALRRGR